MLDGPVAKKKKSVEHCTTSKSHQSEIEANYFSKETTCQKETPQHTPVTPTMTIASETTVQYDSTATTVVETPLSRRQGCSAQCPHKLKLESTSRGNRRLKKK